MAAGTLGSKSVGSIVKLNVSGTPREFIVVHQGRPSSMYDVSCDGTWLLMRECFEEHVWHISDVNDYAGSSVRSYLESTLVHFFDRDIRDQIKQVKLPYRPGSGDSRTVYSGENGLLSKVFLLSAREIGTTYESNSYTPDDGTKLDYFRTDRGSVDKIATMNGTAVSWCLRSPLLANGAVFACVCFSWGDVGGNNCSGAYPIRPAVILPTNIPVTEDDLVTTNTAPTVPGSISVPKTINGGTSFKISWAASTDAESNLVGYIVERSIDGGSSWEQICQANVQEMTTVVPFGTSTVMYRVKAYDSQGMSSAWRTSEQRTVINNRAPTAPSAFTVPQSVLGGNPLTLSWKAASDSDGNLEGYALERKADDEAWTEIYRGPALTYTDSITRGWQSVKYRLRAYDSYDAYSSYTETVTRTVDNNFPPVIASDTASGTELGVLTEGASLTYTVTDADNDEVTVTETLDDTPQRSYKAVLGAENTFQAISPAKWQTVLNGPHTLKISASDGKADSAPYTVTFSKQVTQATVTLAQPRAADAAITVCAISINGSIPGDAVCTVEVTNNANDDAPVWEDCTAEVKAGANYVFTNDAAENGFAFNFRLHVERGTSGTGGYITSIQGGYQ